MVSQSQQLGHMCLVRALACQTSHHAVSFLSNAHVAGLLVICRLWE